MVDTKTAGCYTANIMGEADTLEVEGREHVKVGLACGSLRRTRRYALPRSALLRHAPSDGLADSTPLHR